MKRLIRVLQTFISLTDDEKRKIKGESTTLTVLQKLIKASKDSPSTSNIRPFFTKRSRMVVMVVLAHSLNQLSIMGFCLVWLSRRYLLMISIRKSTIPAISQRHIHIPLWHHSEMGDPALFCMYWSITVRELSRTINFTNATERMLICFQLYTVLQTGATHEVIYRTEVIHTLELSVAPILAANAHFNPTSMQHKSPKVIFQTKLYTALNRTWDIHIYIPLYAIYPQIPSDTMRMKNEHEWCNSLILGTKKATLR